MGIKKTLTPVRELHRNTSAYADKTVTVGGWIRNMRASNAFGFIDLNDGTFFKSIQVVIENEKIDNSDLITHQNIGAALTVTGVLALTPGSKQQVLQHRIILFSQSVIRPSSFAPWHSSDRAQILTAQFSECAPLRRRQFMNFLLRTISFT